MLSPPDVVRLQTHVVVTPRETTRQKPSIPIESRIQLTGIIVTPRGINAIVNNERVRKDDEIQGARVVRITPNCVDFEYHKKTFKKCIQ